MLKINNHSDFVVVYQYHSSGGTSGSSTKFSLLGRSSTFLSGLDPRGGTTTSDLSFTILLISTVFLAELSTSSFSTLFLKEDFTDHQDNMSV